MLTLRRDQAPAMMCSAYIYDRVRRTGYGSVVVRRGELNADRAVTLEPAGVEV